MSGQRESCARVRGRLDRGLDGALEPLEEALDRGHLEACEPCARERARRLSLLGELRRAGAPDAEEAALVVRAVLAHLPASAPRAARRTGSPAALVGAAAALLALLLLQHGGARVAPRVADLPALDNVVERLPGWSELVRGLDGLARAFSG